MSFSQKYLHLNYITFLSMPFSSVFFIYIHFCTTRIFRERRKFNFLFPHKNFTLLCLLVHIFLLSLFSNLIRFWWKKFGWNHIFWRHFLLRRQCQFESMSLASLEDYLCGLLYGSVCIVHMSGWSFLKCYCQWEIKL